jgi:hypothetical protein
MPNKVGKRQEKTIDMFTLTVRRWNVITSQAVYVLCREDKLLELELGKGEAFKAIAVVDPFTTGAYVAFVCIPSVWKMWESGWYNPRGT